MYYFYIIRSLKNNKLYLGSTSDLKERIKSHNNGENKATKPNVPYELIFYSGFKNKKDAINCEQYFKTTSGWKRIHKMLKRIKKLIIKLNFIFLPLIYLIITVPQKGISAAAQDSYFFYAMLISILLVTFTTKTLKAHFIKSIIGLLIFSIATELFINFRGLLIRGFLTF